MKYPLLPIFALACVLLPTLVSASTEITDDDDNEIWSTRRHGPKSALRANSPESRRAQDEDTTLNRRLGSGSGSGSGSSSSSSSSSDGDDYWSYNPYSSQYSSYSGYSNNGNSYNSYSNNKSSSYYGSSSGYYDAVDYYNMSNSTSYGSSSESGSKGMSSLTYVGLGGIFLSAIFASVFHSAANDEDEHGYDEELGRGRASKRRTQKEKRREASRGKSRGKSRERGGRRATKKRKPSANSLNRDTLRDDLRAHEHHAPQQYRANSGNLNQNHYAPPQGYNAHHEMGGGMYR